MKKHKVSIALSYLFGLLVTAFGLYCLITEFKNEIFSYFGLVMSSSILLIGIYLISSAYSHIFTIITTVFGLILSCFAIAVIANDIDNQIEIGIDLIGLFVFLFTIGFGLVFFGIKINRHFKNKEVTNHET